MTQPALTLNDRRVLRPGRPRHALVVALGAALSVAACASPPAEQADDRESITTPTDAFVNWETPHVHPLEQTPDGRYLLAVNTADARLEVYDARGQALLHVGSIPVGVDPVSVRARSNDEVWVVNHISDSISIVSLSDARVRATLQTADEPADIIFAGRPQRAFVSCSQANMIQVFDPAEIAATPVNIPIAGEDPRALAVTPSGRYVLAAIFESGNGSTILAGDASFDLAPSVVNDPAGPHGGVNPPPNDGDGFNPPLRPEYGPNGPNPAPPVGLIVRKSNNGAWTDDNGGDWTPFVSGPLANRSGRNPGWDLPDRDVAVIDTTTGRVRYASGLMNTVMGIAVNPRTGLVTAVGTEATNEIRYEPVLKGRFIRVHMSAFRATAPNRNRSTDLNAGHLDYSNAQVARQANPASSSQALRDRSIGDPRAIVWAEASNRGWVAGMGSNNLIVIDDQGVRIPDQALGGAGTIEVGQGPTGLVLDEGRNRLYVLNKFDASISVVDIRASVEVSRASFYDPTPEVIRLGRPHLYDTHETSGLGQIACGSCHLDARIDRLAWDLGSPEGDMKAINGFPGQHNLFMGARNPADFPDFHPMKGPMTTQTLQDIIGKEPLHWRGDKDGLEEFNGAFEGLQGDDGQLTPSEMQEFEDFLATIHFPPNPFRNLDNTLKRNIPLPGHFASGRFANTGGLPAGAPLPNGNAQRGLDLYRPPNLLDGGVFACVTCHTLTTGAGADVTLDLTTLLLNPIPEGPNGEHHLALSVSPFQTMKIPQLRNMYDKVGFDTTRLRNLAGFGFVHDGTVDSLARLVSLTGFQVQSDQDVADLVALMLSFSGSDLPEGSPDARDLEPPGVPSLDTHAAVGKQLTVNDANRNSSFVRAFLAGAQALANTGKTGLIVKTAVDGQTRGATYVGNGIMQTDRAAVQVRVEDLRASNLELTFTAVPIGTEIRMGIDRDNDGAFDMDEIDGCSDPTNPSSLPNGDDCARPDADALVAAL